MNTPLYTLKTKTINGRTYLVGYQLKSELENSIIRPIGNDEFVGILPKTILTDYYQPCYYLDDNGALVYDPLPPPETELLKKELANLLDYINNTDWYITREYERKISVPDDISQKRLQAVNRINEIRQILGQNSIAL